MFATVQDWSSITDRESISKYLPFRDFETNTGIFATNDDGFGILVECSCMYRDWETDRKSVV